MYDLLLSPLVACVPLPFPPPLNFDAGASIGVRPRACETCRQRCTVQLRNFGGEGDNYPQLGRARLHASVAWLIASTVGILISATVPLWHAGACLDFVGGSLLGWFRGTRRLTPARLASLQ